MKSWTRNVMPRRIVTRFPSNLNFWYVEFATFRISNTGWNLLYGNNTHCTLCVYYPRQTGPVQCKTDKSVRDLRLDWGTMSVFSVGWFITVSCGLWLITDSVAIFWWEAGVYPLKGRRWNFVESGEKWFCVDQRLGIIIKRITIYTEVSLSVIAACQFKACIQMEQMIKIRLIWFKKNIYWGKHL